MLTSGFAVFHIPANEKETQEYLPIDTTLGGLDADEIKEADFDSETF